MAQGEPRLLAPPARSQLTASAPAASSASTGTRTTDPASTRPSLLSPPATSAPAASGSAAANTRPTNNATINPASNPSVSAPRDLTPAFTADNRSGLKVTKGSGVLPNEHGQVWREYDISPYTNRVRDVARPEQAVIDWIVRETGTEVWFTEPLGILSAGSSTLRVYHTPEMQQKVQGVVERLVATGAESHALSVRLATVGSPNWRARAISLIKPVDVKSPGVEAWLVSRENAAVLYDQLKQRGDFREHNSPQSQVQNGQSQTFARSQPRQYSRGIQIKSEYPFYDLIPGQIDEGYSLAISPLMSLDGASVDAAIECQVDQVEKLLPIAIDVPIGKQSQRVQIQVPQMASWRLNERFRWPADQVLLLSCGVVANPAANAAGPLAMLNPLSGTGNRADALLLIEHRGAAAEGGSNSAVSPATAMEPATGGGPGLHSKGPVENWSPPPVPVVTPIVAPVAAPAPAKAAPPSRVVPASAVSPFRRY